MTSLGLPEWQLSRSTRSSRLLPLPLLFLTAIRLGATRTGALFAAAALAFATPFFGWSTTFFAHSVSGSLLMFIAAGHRLRVRTRSGLINPGRRPFCSRSGWGCCWATRLSLT